jgi:hypothetical protein
MRTSPTRHPVTDRRRSPTRPLDVGGMRCTMLALLEDPASQGEFYLQPGMITSVREEQMCAPSQGFKGCFTAEWRRIQTSAHGFEPPCETSRYPRASPSCVEQFRRRALRTYGGLPPRSHRPIDGLSASENAVRQVPTTRWLGRHGGEIRRANGRSLTQPLTPAPCVYDAPSPERMA